MAVAAPFHMQHAIDRGDLFFGVGLVLGIVPAVPAGPDGGGIDVGDIGGEGAAANRGHARGVGPVGDIIQLGHEGADGLFVEDFEVAGPVVFIAQSPEDHGRMITVLVDHVAQHAARLILVSVAAEAPAGPGDLFPYQHSQLVAQVEHLARLLVVGQADEVGAHVLDEPHFFADEVFGHGGAQARVVFVPRGAAQEQLFAIQMEDAVFGELEIAQAEALFDAVLAVSALQSNGAGVQIGRLGRPQRRCGHGERRDGLCARPRRQRFLRRIDHLPRRVEHARLNPQVAAESRGVEQARRDGDGGAAGRHARVDEHTFQRESGRVDQVDAAVEAAVAVEIALVRRNGLVAAGVVAQHRELHLPVGVGPLQRARRGLGNIEGEFVVSAHVAAHALKPDKDFARLAGAFEVQQGAAVGVRVVQRERGSVPGGALIIRTVRIYRVPGVEAVGHGHLAPLDVGGGGFAPPHFPDAREGSAIVLPTVGQAADCGSLGGGRAGPRDQRRSGERGSALE